jgi:hypothetical protein
MRLFLVAGTALGCVALSLAACSDDVPTAIPVVSFAEAVQPIFTTRCVACHDAVLPTPPSANPMNLEAGAAYANVVNVAAVQTGASTLLDRIEPGNPEASYLIHKIQGTHTATTVSGSGARMPLNCPTDRPCLSAAEIQMIRQWVLEGAVNN